MWETAEVDHDIILLRLIVYFRKAGVPENFFDSAKTKAFLNLNKENKKIFEFATHKKVKFKEKKKKNDYVH